MAEHDNTAPVYDEPKVAGAEESVESTDRGLFGFGKKKEDEVTSETALSSDFGEKVKVSEEEPKKEGLLHKLHRSDSSSSSSSDEEEVEEGGVKKKKLKEKIKDKVKGDKKPAEDTSIPVEKHNEVPPTEEKKGFMDKIKEKFPGNKKTDEVAPAPAAAVVAPPHVAAVEPTTPTEEKKGFMDKIKEKLPGFSSKTEEEKEKEKEKNHH